MYPAAQPGRRRLSSTVVTQVAPVPIAASSMYPCVPGDPSHSTRGGFLTQAGAAVKADEADGVKMVLVVAAALIDQQGRVLLAQRPEGKAMAGLWEFPGGKVEEGETPEVSLARELREELNVHVDVADLKPLAFASHTYDRCLEHHSLDVAWLVHVRRSPTRV
jgi:ADP-ribose pyrophosphatase YjhB (NUDIX family)